MSLSKRIQSLEQNTLEAGNEEGDIFLSDDLARVMYEVPLIDRIVTGDLPYTSEAKEILQEQCFKLGLDASKMEQELQAARNCEGFLLCNDMSPRGRVMTFMCSKKMGSKARDLYNALNQKHALTDEQKLILQKICQKMGHTDWYEAILVDIEEEIAAREQGYEQQSPAADDRSLPGRLPGDQY